MNSQQENLSAWRSSAGKAFWGVILTSFAGIISTIYDYISYVAYLIEFITKKMSSITEGFGGGGEGLTAIDLEPLFALGFSSKGLVIIGYILYLWGLTSFAAIQKNDSTMQNVKKVRTATILLIITFLLNIVFGVLGFIPLVGMLFNFITWVMFLVCFYMMKHAFSELMIADGFSQRAQRGARNLRYAACCEIRLKWLPLVTAIIVILMVIMFIGMAHSAKSFEDLKSILQIGSVLVGVVFLFAFVIALFAMFCAFFWPMIGWYRIKTGGPAIAEQDELSTNNNALQTEDVSVKDGIIEGAEGEEFQDGETDNRKKLYIGGGVLGAILIGLGLWYFFPSNNNNNPIGIDKPKWEKFVIVEAEEVPFHKEARSDSPQLMTALENLESDAAGREFRWEDQGKKRGYTIYPFHVEKNTVLPVLEESDTWYKVLVDDEFTNCSAYIKKEWTREVQPEPITEEVLERINKTELRCDYLVKSGKLKNLILTSRIGDMDSEYLHVGSLVNGILIYPLFKQISLYSNNDLDKTSFDKNEDYNCYTLTYGDGQSVKLNEYATLFEPHKLTNDEVEKIFEAIKDNESLTPMTVEYYFPEVSKDRLFRYIFRPEDSNNLGNSDNNENINITGFRVSGNKLIAELGATYEETDISEDCDIDIADIGDYDGNGDVEAVVYKKLEDSDGMKEPPFVVYYDRASAIYKRSEPLLLTTWVTKEDQEGKTTLVQSLGVHTVRYVFDKNELQQVENTYAGIGKMIATWTCKELYPNGDDAERTVTFDIDGDGSSEIIAFGHNDSRACAYGRDMFVDKITWANGQSIGDEYFGLQSAYSFSVLESMSNGMHDLLLDDAWFFRWNGSLYEKCIWNGSEFVVLAE